MTNLQTFDSSRLHRDRKHGYFRPRRVLPHGQLVVAVDVDTVEGEYRETDHRSTHYLAGWSAAAAKFTRGGTVTTKSMRGVTSDQFWRWLHNRAVLDSVTWKTKRRGGSKPPMFIVTVLGFDLARTLPLLRTYDQSMHWHCEFVSTGATPSVSLVEEVDGLRLSFRFVDCTRVWDTPVEELAKQLGAAQPVNATERAALVLDAFTRWREFVLSNRLGRVAMSIGAQSMMSYHEFCPPKMLCVHDNPNVLALERAACAGGYMVNTKTGRVGAGLLVDYRSAYVDAMRNPMPVKLVGSNINPTLAELDAALGEGYLVVARVTLHPHYPTLLTRCRRHTVNSVGVRSRWIDQWHQDEVRCARGHQLVVTTPELAAIRESIASVDEWAVYRADSPFVDWANHIWQVRCAAPDDFTKSMVKRVATALHGRFGYQPTVWVGEDNLDQWGGDFSYWWGMCGGECAVEGTHRHQYRQMLGRVERQDKYREAADSMPAVYAHVTAYARMKLLELIEAAEWSNLFYADTDGIIVRPAAEVKIPRDWFGDGLGDLSRDYLREVEIAGVKRYRYLGGAKLSGVPTSGRRVEGGRWEWEEWQDWFPGDVNSDGVAYSYTRSMRYPLEDNQC